MDARNERRRRTQNRILRALPRDDFLRFSQRATWVQLRRGAVLADATGSGRVYFIMSGACSAVLTTMSGHKIEVASISCEGVTSVLQREAIALDLQLIVTVDHASAVRVSLSTFESEMDRRGTLHDLVTTYYRALREELLVTVACSRLHSSRARYCRKVLNLADRIGSDTLHATHAALALMLGLTRPSVTLIALDLKRRGVIDYARDRIVILDRPQLERTACDCYQTIRCVSEERAAVKN
jgi:CRP-like cAMP-binding protein